MALAVKVVLNPCTINQPTWAMGKIAFKILHGKGKKMLVASMLSFPRIFSSISRDNFNLAFEPYLNHYLQSLNFSCMAETEFILIICILRGCFQIYSKVNKFCLFVWCKMLLLTLTWLHSFSPFPTMFSKTFFFGSR